uniref:FTH domain-containing protein n=1 Tax=Caenorhabditis tropicalis TaxID=1561998 RepID=A0A1I7UP72_9PELO
MGLSTNGIENGMYQEDDIENKIFSEKIDFDYKLSDWKGRSDLEVNMENVQETLVPFLGFVFRIANVKRLVNHITPEESKIFSQIDSSSLRINDIYGELPLELLRKCEGLQDLYGCFRGKLSELLSLPSISSVKWFTLQISNMSAEDFLQIAEKFIELDVNIGSRVEDQVYTKTLRIKPFVTAFANLEILNQIDRLIRMGTRNPAKHMLFYIHEELEVRMIVMIPSDIEETDYERCLRM